ncbi:NuA4 histone H4 acetyltransferase complex and the SWR1 complex subunit [Lecanora helva]
MPAPKITKKNRIQGVQVYRPFVYGSIAKPLDPTTRKPTIHADHTHTWTVYVRGLDNEDLSYWLKKVQFKLHETYPNSSRMVETPPFAVSETGWGEFEVQMKLYFVPEANEKAQTLWHHLKLHPFGEGAEGARERREAVVSQCYEEVLFNEPVEGFFDILTSGPPPVSGRGGKGGAGGKGGGAKNQIAGRPRQGERSAEVPERESKENPYCLREELREVERLREAEREVERLVGVERERLREKEGEMEGLRKEAEVWGRMGET